jgi:hypothetical protein
MEPSLAPREVRAEPITGTQEVRTETSPDTIGTQKVRDEDQPGQRPMIPKFHGGGGDTITGTQEVCPESSQATPRRFKILPVVMVAAAPAPPPAPRRSVM